MRRIFSVSESPGFWLMLSTASRQMASAWEALLSEVEAPEVVVCACRALMSCSWLSRLACRSAALACSSGGMYSGCTTVTVLSVPAQGELEKMVSPVADLHLNAWALAWRLRSGALSSISQREVEERMADREPKELISVWLPVMGFARKVLQEGGYGG